MFNQISSKLTIIFLFVPFTLTSIYTFFLWFLRLEQHFWPKTCISSRSEHVQPNFVKIYNNVLVGTLYTSVNTFFLVSIFKLKNCVFSCRKCNYRNGFPDISLKVSQSESQKVWKSESLRKKSHVRGPHLEQVGAISIKLHRNVPEGTPILTA